MENETNVGKEFSNLVLNIVACLSLVLFFPVVLWVTCIKAFFKFIRWAWE
jgi:hypothetical protein